MCDSLSIYSRWDYIVWLMQINIAISNRSELSTFCSYSSRKKDVSFEQRLPKSSYLVELIQKRLLYKENVLFKESFPQRTATWWNRLLLRCFPEHYELNLFKGQGSIFIYPPYPHIVHSLSLPLSLILHRFIINIFSLYLE